MTMSKKQSIRLRTLFYLLLIGPLLTGCESDITVCECLRDDGTHKKECDRLGNSMTDEEMSREIKKCK